MQREEAERERRDAEKAVTEKKVVESREQGKLIVGCYRDNGNGTVTDVTTGLQWMRCAMGQNWNGAGCLGDSGTHTWDTARGLNSNFVGYADLRLPSIKELLGLVYCSSGIPKTWSEAERC